MEEIILHPPLPCVSVIFDIFLSRASRGHVDRMLFSYDSRVLLRLSSYRISCIAAQDSSALVALVVFWFCAPPQPVYFKTGVNSIDVFCGVQLNRRQGKAVKTLTGCLVPISVLIHT